MTYTLLLPLTDECRPGWVVSAYQWDSNAHPDCCSGGLRYAYGQCFSTSSHMKAHSEVKETCAEIYLKQCRIHRSYPCHQPVPSRLLHTSSLPLSSLFSASLPFLPPRRCERTRGRYSFYFFTVFALPRYKKLTIMWRSPTSLSLSLCFSSSTTSATSPVSTIARFF